MNILGISCWYHDAAACLLREGRIVAAAQEERFSRQKHDAQFPAEALAYCLTEGGLAPGDLDRIAFYDKPFLKFERLLETYLHYAPRGLRSFLKAMPLWLKQKLWIRDRIATALGDDLDCPVLFPEHHQSHAASAFFPSPFERAAILTTDGVGEWATTTCGSGRGNDLRLHAEIQFPHSLGLLYSAFTYYCGFRVNAGEYKLMGLAPYGEPRFADTIRDELIDIKDDGSFRLNMRYFTYPVGLRMTGRRFARLFGGPRREPESDLTRRVMDLARSVQVVTEEVILKMARHVHGATGERNLCLAGGVALNCVANGRLLRDGPFDDVWIQPAAGDAGGALGAALLAWHRHAEGERPRTEERDHMQGAYLGPAFSDDEVAQLLEREDVPYERVSSDELPQRVAQLLADGNVVGWLQGRMEWGPRALGNRSILADPRRRDMQRLVNEKIKFRESFRPFAPSVLAESRSEYFDLDRPSPYMLLVAQVRGAEVAGEGLEQIRHVESRVPAVTHVDGSARVQTVHAETNPRYHRLLGAFETLTGCPVLVNTSFNVRGEPIVCTPADAYRCFRRTHMDALVVGSFVVTKAMPAEHVAETYGLD